MKNRTLDNLQIKNAMYILLCNQNLLYFFIHFVTFKVINNNNSHIEIYYIITISKFVLLPIKIPLFQKKLNFLPHMSCFHKNS